MGLAVVVVVQYHVLWIKTGFVAVCQGVYNIMLRCSVIWIKTGLALVVLLCVPIPMDCKEI
jgi:hypothetical protein